MKKIIKKIMAWLAIFVLALPLNAIPQKAMAAVSTDVIINEFLANPGTVVDSNGNGTVEESNDEFIELVNMSVTSATINGWTLSDSDNNTYTFPTPTTIPAQGYLVIYGSTTGNNVTLNNTNESISLKNGSTIIDSVSYTSSENDISRGRVPDAEDTNTDSVDFKNFGGTTGVPTPGASNVPTNPVITLPVTATVINTLTTTISGTTTPTRTVRLYKNASEVATVSPTTSNSQGLFSFNNVALTQDAVNDFTVKAENGSNAATPAVAVPTITEDSILPVVPTVTNPSIATSVNSASATITGEAETGSTVKVYGDTTNDGSIASEIVVASGTANSPYSILVPLVRNSTNNFLITTTDAAGNESLATDVPTITEDSTNPNLTVSSPIDGQLVATATPTATYSATDTNLAGVTVSIDNGVATAYTSGASLGTLANGSHLLKFTATDTAGNSTSISRNIIVNTNLSSVSTNLPLPANTSNALIDDSANSGIVLDGINTTGDVTINIGKYDNNPGSDLSGVSAFGKYFEISASDTSKITFPLIIKIYYTQADLDSAGITEDKLDGIYFYNSISGKYERYSDSGVNTTDVILGTTQYSGYVYANADHLTPIIAAYDIIAPSKPANFNAESGDGKVTLKWDSVSGADKYKVRYRKSTNADNTSYTYTDVNSDKTSLEISGLQNVTEYEFGIASQDAVSNTSDWAVVVATPIASATTSSITTTPKVVKAVAVTQNTPQLPTFEDLSSTEEKETVKNEPEASDDEGKIKGEQTEQAGSKSAVTVAILLLAIAAGIGGYYLYEWWVAKGALAGVSAPKEIKPVGKNPSSKRKNQKGRW